MLVTLLSDATRQVVNLVIRSILALSVLGLVPASTPPVFAQDIGDHSEDAINLDDDESLLRAAKRHLKRLGKSAVVIGCVSGATIGAAACVTGVAPACAGSIAGGCIRGAIAGATLGLVAANAAVPDVGNRPATGAGFVLAFSGEATNGAESVLYQGTRIGPTIRGTYEGEEPGTFAGTINRAGRVTGRFKEGQSSGVFSGQATPALDRVIGTSTCTQNCE